MGKFLGTRFFLLFLPCLLLHSTQSSKSLEPILVETCVDSTTGDCTAGKVNCNIRAAVSLCINIAPPVCNILVPYGTHHMTYGALNITTNTSTRIFISSTFSAADPCYSVHSENNNQAVIDGSGQKDRFLNVHTGAYLELSDLDVTNFGHANLNFGGAVFNLGGFVANNVNFYGNQAQIGAVALNGEFATEEEEEEEEEDKSTSIFDHNRIITSTKSTLYVQHSTCSDSESMPSAVSNATDPYDLFSASGQAYLDCSPSCTIGGSVHRSFTCSPTQTPTIPPTFTEPPTTLSHNGDDDGSSNDDFFSDLTEGFTAPAVAVVLGVIVCLMLCCLLGGKMKTQSPNSSHRNTASISSIHDSKEVNYSDSRIHSSILESMYKHFGVDAEGGGGLGNEDDDVEKSASLSEPFLQAALDSMEGKPGDWIIDVRALQLGPMIGVGSSAHVFSATYFGQRVAAKRLPALTWKPDEVETFLRHEAGLLVHLHHPSVIKFYGVGISGDYVYMVTELCCGSLTNLIDRANAHPSVEQAAVAASQKFRMKLADSGRQAGDLMGSQSEKAVVSEAAARVAAMPLDLLLSLALGVAQGVEFLHSRGVVHRDLKPDNVLLTESNEVKLCDFGISRMEHDRAGMTTAVGTPLLMAPELVLSETASMVGADATAVDVFSFGVLLWMISTQHLCPYDGVENPWLLLSQVTQGRRPPLELSNSNESIKLRGTNLLLMPQQFRDLIANCWHPDPSARPTFSMITEELEFMMDQMVDEQIKLQQDSRNASE